MKALLTIFAFMAIVGLVTPGQAQDEWQNELGIYTETLGVNATAEPGSVHQVYLALTNPYNEEDAGDVFKIHGYECQIVLDGPGQIVDLEWPVWALNIGDYYNQIVAYGHEDVRTRHRVGILATIHVQYQGDGTEPLTLSLQPTEPASIAGKMAYLDGHDNHVAELMPMTSVAGSFDMPVFGFNADPQVVATEETTMDAIKALYR